MHKNKVQIENCTLYLGDCMEIMPALEKFDAVITDPPYGLNENSNKVSSRGALTKAKDYGEFEWDKFSCSKEQISAMIAISKWQAIFGGNYFDLPATSCYLVWDKLNSGDFADAELCWTNWPKAVRVYRHLWNGMIRKNNEERFHPTQKPLNVMSWIIGLCPKSGTILDPFMGSGTTGLACIGLSNQFTGIEKDERYFDIACKRIENACMQSKLF